MKSPKSLTFSIVQAVLHGILVGTIAFGPIAQAKFTGESAAVLVDSITSNPPPAGELPPELKAVAKRRAADYLKSPKWLRKILDRTVGSYVPVILDLSKGIPQSALDELANDAEKAFNKMDEDAGPNSQFKNFVEQNLKPYLKNLKPENLISYFHGKTMAHPLANQTVETTIVKRMVVYLSQYTDYPKRLLATVLGPSLKYASYWQTYILLGGMAYLLMPEMSTAGSVFLLATIWFSFKAGPLAAIFNALSGFFVRPMTEQARVIEKRYTYKLEQKINSFFDSINPKTSAEAQASAPISERNDRVRIADLERDGTDFAGMSPEEQLQNWEAGLQMFVGVAAKFGQLLRDTHHHGRDLMMLSWIDEQSVTQLVEIMDSKLVILRAETDGILNPHKTAFLMRERPDSKEDLEARMKKFEALSERMWLEPDMDYPTRIELEKQIQASVQSLREMGLSIYDIDRLLQIQKAKGRSVNTLITTLTLGELRTFYHAERNRNLAEPARRIQLVIKNGLGKQELVAAHQPLISRMQRQMGLQNSDKPGSSQNTTDGLSPSAIDKCESILDGTGTN